MGKKRIVVAALFLLIALVVVDAGTQKIIIDVGESTLINGKNITLMGLGKTGVSIKVDSVIAEVPEGLVDKFVNGVLITLIGFSASPPTAILNITINFVCGDGTCDQYEDHLICCTDCNCSLAAEKCVNNMCVTNFSYMGSSLECVQDTDCPDNETCTSDRCNLGMCENAPVSSCENSDGCCPLECTLENDNDCLLVNKCALPEDCKDSNPCTTDQCAGSPLLCSHVRNPGCALADQCLAEGSINENTYCISDEWTEKKGNLLPCKEGYECQSGSCKESVCGGKKKNWWMYIVYALGGIVILVLLSYINVHLKKPRSSLSSSEDPSKPQEKQKPLKERPVVEIK